MIAALWFGTGDSAVVVAEKSTSATDPGSRMLRRSCSSRLRLTRTHENGHTRAVGAEVGAEVGVFVAFVGAEVGTTAGVAVGLSVLGFGVLVGPEVGTFVLGVGVTVVCSLRTTLSLTLKETPSSCSSACDAKKP